MPSMSAREVSAPRPSAAAPLVLAAAGACLLTTFLTTGCTHTDNNKSNETSPLETLAMRDVPPDSTAESQQRGRKVFEHYCSICHGINGQGDGFNSSNLAVPPRNFADQQFWKQATDEKLILVVSKGGPAAGKSVLMPAWGRTLTERQMHDAVAYLRTLVVRNEPKDAQSVPQESH
jgi:cytochrome c oxidase cbb3-type subunit 3